MPQFTVDEMKEILETCYESVCIGTPGEPAADILAQAFLEEFGSPEYAAAAYSDEQAKKDSTTGFLAGLGGFLTRSETDEVEVAGILNEQMRMAAVIAGLGGQDIHDPLTKVKICSCLVQPGMDAIAAKAGGSPEAQMELIADILAREYSETGFMDLIKAVPLAGGLARICQDYRTSRAIAGKACETFLDTNILYTQTS